MSWRRNRTERPPRVGAAVLAKALAGVFVVFSRTGAGVAGAGYFQIPSRPTPPEGAPPAPPPIDDPGGGAPEPSSPAARARCSCSAPTGAPRRSTDAKLYGQAEQPHSDTIVLSASIPKRNRIAVLSLPRDLAVTIPGYADNTKINQAYDEGGAALTLETVKLPVRERDRARSSPSTASSTSTSTASSGRSTTSSGVYVDVDRDYYNPEGTGFAAIDIKPGYQRLVGSDALAYVRYRHTDSDIFRNARQQDFLRQAASQPAVDEAQEHRRRRATSSARCCSYFRFDKKFLSAHEPRRACSRPRSTSRSTTRRSTRSRSQGITESEDPTADTRLYISNENLQKAYDAVHDRRGRRATRSARRRPRRSKKQAKASTRQRAGERAPAGRGHGRARRAAAEDAPVLLPGVPHDRLALRQRHAAHLLAARRAGQAPPRLPDRDLHRRARRVLRRPGHDLARPAAARQPGPRSARSTAASCCCTTTARSCARSAGGRRAAVYYVTNTLNRRLSNARMLAIAVVIEATELVGSATLGRRLGLGRPDALPRRRARCCPDPARPGRRLRGVPGRRSLPVLRRRRDRPARRGRAALPAGVRRRARTARSTSPTSTRTRSRSSAPTAAFRRELGAAGTGPGGLTAVGARRGRARRLGLRGRRRRPDRPLRRRRVAAELVGLERHRRRASSTSARAAATTPARAAGSRSARTARSTSPTRATTASSASPPTGPAPVVIVPPGRRRRARRGWRCAARG